MRTETIGTATLHLGDSRDVDWTGVDIVTDPPYGISYRVNERTFSNRGHGLKATSATVTAARAAVVGDDEPFDPTLWLRDRCAFFGAQHFHTRLPAGRWLIWDKRNGSKPDDHSDADLVWMTGDSRQAMRIHRQLWRGVCRAGEENCSRSKKLHTNQKPVALIGVIFDMLGILGPVGDPYMGSGSTGVVAIRRALPFIGCEIDEGHFETACARLRAEAENMAPPRQPALV